MFGLSAQILYAFAFLVFTNLFTLTAWRITDSAFDAFKAETSAIGEKAAIRATAQQNETDRTLKETSDAWAKVLDHVRADAARRLRYAGGGQVPSTPGAAGLGNGTAEDALPDPARLAADCAEVTVQLLYHQDTANKIQTIQRQYDHE